MKCDFFYDDGQGKPYESIHVWYKDIRHLIIPAIIMMVLGIAVLLYLDFSLI